MANDPSTSRFITVKCSSQIQKLYFLSRRCTLGKNNCIAEFIKTKAPHGQVENVIYVQASHSLFSSQLLLLTNAQFTGTADNKTFMQEAIQSFLHSNNTETQ